MIKNNSSILTNEGGLSRTVPKILIVENDLALADMLAELFSFYGYEYKIYNDAEEILPIVENFKPDLVLLDFLLSLVNGGELCSQIKKNEATSDLPVIIYSAFPKVLLSLGDYGCDDFIAKPFDLDHLMAKIEKLLNGKFSDEQQMC